jgi:CelD/BcsL family acetyltransferase involved in cellulose biosynthesis
MRVTVVRPDELGRDEATRWRELQRSSAMGSHPCLSLTYALATGRMDERTRVAVAEDAGEIVAFLPYQDSSDRIALPLAGNAGVDGLVYSGSVDVRQVVRGAGLRGYRFYHAPVEQAALASHRYHHNVPATVHVAALPGGYEDYLATLTESSLKRIDRTARYRRALARQVGPVVFEWHSFTPERLRLLTGWKSAQFDEARRTYAQPAEVARLGELATSASDDCSGVMSVLLAAGQPVTITINLRSGSLLTPWVTAYDPEFSRFSTGMIGWLDLLAAATGQGVTKVDFGYGANDYKRWLGNSSYEQGGGVVWAGRLEGAGRRAYRQLRFRASTRGGLNGSLSAARLVLGEDTGKGP